jgi:UDPglucose--hexose-1-phosphate uridylyltransferase
MDSEFRTLNLADVPHRRLNLLTGEWVLVSPQRAKRPWLGAVEKSATEKRPAYDPTCYLCPRNKRVNSDPNPDYDGVYVFDNDFPALLNIEVESEPIKGDSDLFVAQADSGVCRVICFSPRHDLTLAELDVRQIRAVVDTWVAQCAELGARKDINYVQLFENKGEIMGCSNPHPHGQLWATRNIPTEIEKETRAQQAYMQKHAAPLLMEYVSAELKAQTRVLYENAHFVALVPFWAVWPFETMILPKRHVRRIVDLSDAEREGLSDALKNNTARYDRLFNVSFPYTMGVHQAPYDGAAHDEWQMHLHFYPPLLRSATVKKFMVGYEMLAQPQRDLTPEQAAERLRGV